MKKKLLIFGVVFLFGVVISFIAIGDFLNKNSEVIDDVLSNSNKDSGINDNLVEIPTEKTEANYDDVEGSNQENSVVTPSSKKVMENANNEKTKEYRNEDGSCAIKGFHNKETDVKVAVLPSDAMYDVIPNDVTFCTLQEAELSNYYYFGDEVGGDSDKFLNHPEVQYNK